MDVALLIYPEDGASDIGLECYGDIEDSNGVYDNVNVYLAYCTDEGLSTLVSDEYEMYGDFDENMSLDLGSTSNCVYVLFHTDGSVNGSTHSGFTCEFCVDGECGGSSTLFFILGLFAGVGAGIWCLKKRKATPVRRPQAPVPVVDEPEAEVEAMPQQSNYALPLHDLERQREREEAAEREREEAEVAANVAQIEAVYQEREREREAQRQREAEMAQFNRMSTEVPAGALYSPYPTASSTAALAPIAPMAVPQFGVTNGAPAPGGVYNGYVQPVYNQQFTVAPPVPWTDPSKYNS
ncbi:hypothetical protein KIPB_008070 [Kipferlia bialata]|uniref:CUB domain-containing protein n=1 Tax=Kipferlia bialata TaxID=797122 RepID=A0A9K3D037_9EUKA|nr:hypothetical protein KIPB_008070 [Kipferlia bialata]|eukprot:g8070.t1